MLPIYYYKCMMQFDINGYPSLVLVQPKKTRPCLTERLLMGRKESNQTNKQIDINGHILIIT